MSLVNRIKLALAIPIVALGVSALAPDADARRYKNCSATKAGDTTYFTCSDPDTNELQELICNTSKIAGIRGTVCTRPVPKPDYLRLLTRVAARQYQQKLDNKSKPYVNMREATMGETRNIWKRREAAHFSNLLSF